MRKSVTVLPLLAMLVLAACDNGAAPLPAPVDAKAAAADRALVARLSALPPAQRDVVLFRAIRDAGQACQGIAASARIADMNGRPAWSARCDRGEGDYLLVLSPAGLLNVTRGRDVRR